MEQIHAHRRKNRADLSKEPEDKYTVKRFEKPIAIFPHDDNDILINVTGYRPYLHLDELIAIKNKLDASIEFARNNDIKALNRQYVEDYMQRERNSRNEEPSIKKENKKTNVYLMIDKNTGFYKIGRSIDPVHREYTLQSEKPTIELIAYWEAFEADETNLHKKYSKKRIRGEWFNLTEQDVNNILSQVNPIQP